MGGRGLVCGAVLAAAAGAAQGQWYLETFTNGVNAGGWTFGAPVETIPATGGSSGAYLRAEDLDTTIPRLRSTGESVFTGNYRARRVGQLAVDAAVFSTDFPIGAFPMTLMLISENGTPGDPTDDYAAILPHQLAIPQPGAGWRRYVFNVPSQAAALPAGWAWIQFGPGSPTSPDWNVLIQDVDSVAFSFGDPRNFYIFQMWRVGADNVQIAPSCYANCDESTVAPIVNVNDFVCFHNRFVTGDTRANCDGSTMPPVLNVMDYICFQTRYAAGCE